MDQKEIRVIRRPLELRAVKGDDGGDVFTGYVFKWGTESEDLGGFVETVRKGAAAKFLAAPPHNLFAVLDHDKDVCKVLGDLESGTLKLSEDDVGLRFEVHAGPTTAARDAAVVVNRNRVGMSFAFVRGADQWSTLPDGTKLRELLEFADIDDVSIVVDPAYKSSDVTVAKRGLQEAIDAERRRETEKIETEKRQAADAKRLAEETEQRKHKEIAEMEAADKRPSVDYLQRSLDLVEMEYRCVGQCVAAASENGPDHAADRREAHRATERALEAKRSTGAPSRALELKAAEAHKRAAASAAAEEKPAAAEFHKAAQKMHDAAASDAYAADFQTGVNFRAAGESGVERRDNAHHDEDGKFHDGSPESILSASRGKLVKAEARHKEAAAAYRSAVLAGQDNPCNVEPAKTAWSEARGAHQDAITAADAAMADVTALQEQRMQEHRDLVLDHKATWAMPEYANPAASTTEDPAAATHANDAPIE